MPLSIVAVDTFTATNSTTCAVTLNAARASGDYLLLLPTLLVHNTASPTNGIIGIYESTYPTPIYWESSNNMRDDPGLFGLTGRMAMPHAWMFYKGSQPASYTFVSAFSYSAGTLNTTPCDWLITVLTIRGLTADDQFYNRFDRPVGDTEFSSDARPMPTQHLLTGQQRGPGTFTAPGPAVLVGNPITWAQVAQSSAAHGSTTVYLQAPPLSLGDATWDDFTITETNTDFVKRAIELPTTGPVARTGWNLWIID
jgi:hypothetical protein